MKIAFILSKFPAVSETFILDEITGLADRGHEIDIYSLVEGDDPKSHQDIEKYNLLTHTYYRPSMPSDFILVFIKGLFLFLKNFSKNPKIMLRTLNVFKFGTKALSFSLVYSAVPFLPEKSYDIVHCHFGPNGLTGVFLREVGAIKGKIVTSFHGYDLSKYVKEHGKKVYDVLFKKGDIFLPVSSHLKARLLELGCDEDKIRVHHMGIKSEKFPFRIRKVPEGELVKVITIGRLIEKKGIDYGIRAVRDLKEKQLKIEYNIIGDGPLRKDLERLIDELKLADAVKLLGEKPHKEVIDLLDEAHILLAPSITAKNADQEGIPVVLMEAMAMGLAVVSTYSSGIPELVEEGRTGCLTSERETGAIAEKVEHLIKHPETFERVTQFARTYIEENFEAENLNARLIDIYRELT